MTTRLLLLALLLLPACVAPYTARLTPTRDLRVYTAGYRVEAEHCDHGLAVIVHDEPGEDWADTMPAGWDLLPSVPFAEFYWTLIRPSDRGRVVTYVGEFRQGRPDVDTHQTWRGASVWVRPVEVAGRFVDERGNEIPALYIDPAPVPSGDDVIYVEPKPRGGR